MRTGCPLGGDASSSNTFWTSARLRQLNKTAADILERIGADGIRSAIERNVPITEEQKLEVLDPKDEKAVPPDVPAVLSRGGAGNNPANVSGLVNVPTAEAAIARITASLVTKPYTSVVQEFNDLPSDVQDQARNQDADERNMKGIFHNGTLYVKAGNHSTMEDLERTVFRFGRSAVRQSSEEWQLQAVSCGCLQYSDSSAMS